MINDPATAKKKRCPIVGADAVCVASIRRYAPSRTAALEPQVLGALDGWCNVAAVCKALGRWSDDGAVRHTLNRLVAAGVVERRTVPTVRGITHQYRRKP